MRCAFTLSTGRCGTMTLAAVLNQHPSIVAMHEPFPRLIDLSGQAYMAPEADVMQFIIRVARSDYISEINHQGKVFVETANRLTFFAYAIEKAFPGAKFIHLVRHPSAVIKSGMRRNWYCGHPWDVGRIAPKDQSCEAGFWNDLSPSEKVAWNWVETNRFIIRFLESIPPERKILVNLENIDAQLAHIWSFLGVKEFNPLIDTFNRGTKDDVKEDFIPVLKKIGQDIINKCGYEI